MYINDIGAKPKLPMPEAGSWSMAVERKKLGYAIAPFDIETKSARKSYKI
jgi:hypothetical protein